MRTRITNFIISSGSNIFIQGGFLLTASNFITGFMNYLFNLLVARSLGPEGFGEITAMFSYMVILSIPIGILNTLLIQKIGSADDKVNYVLSIQAWLVLKLKKWWLILVFILATTPFIPKMTNLTQATGYALPLLIVFSIIGAFYSGAMQGMHMFLWFSILGFVGTLIKLMGPMLVYLGLGDISMVIIFLIISSSFPIYFFYLLFKNKIKNIDGNVKIINKRVLSIFRDKQLWFTAGATGVLALMNNVDIIVVKKMFSAEEAGIYSSWALVAKIIFYVCGPLLSMSYIFFASKKDEVKHQAIFIGLFILFFIVGVVTYLGFPYFGRTIVYILFGNKYLSVIPYLTLASYFGTGYLIMVFMTYYFLAKKSKACLLPTIIFPAYILALIFYPKTISDVMHLDGIFVFVNVAVFLVIFFKDRFLYLFRLSSAKSAIRE
ncbi:MAG: oligosaccharide flippase family protein [Candidatus Roizmanbacteria bacterium]|nr:oligosaccharide flippase family protein [Candidatus Roizmanbacteria bacterium]